MINNKMITLIFFGVLICSNTFASEVEYFWSGGVTNKSAIVSVASDTKAKIKVQYSDSKNFKR